MTDTAGQPVAVVTGAAQGIGRRTAELLATAGFALALNDVRTVDETLASLQDQGTVALPLIADVSDEDAVAAMGELVWQHFGRVDCVVNNAGVSSIVPAEEMEAAEWQRVMDVNLLGPFLMCRTFGRLMLARGQESIVNVASVAGLLGIAHGSLHNASNHGLIGLTQHWPRSGRPRCASKRGVSRMGQDPHG